MSPDPFTHPCDYFLYACTSDKLSSSSVTGQRNRDSYNHPQSLRGSARREKRGNGEEDALDRKAALLLYLREVLGRSLGLQCSLCVRRSAFYCVPLQPPSESEDSWGSAAVQKARRFYQSCLDTKSIDAAGAEPFLALIQKVRVIKNLTF